MSSAMLLGSGRSAGRPASAFRPVGAVDAQGRFGTGLEAAFGNLSAAADTLAVSALIDAVERAPDRGDLVGDRRGLAFERLDVLHLYRALRRIGIDGLGKVGFDTLQAIFEIGELRFEARTGG